MNLSTGQENSSESSVQEQIESTEASRKKRDSSLISENDLEEKNESAEEHEEDTHVDYSAYTKEQFVEVVKALTKEDKFARIDAVIREVKPLYDELRDKEREEALERFKKEGGEETDFDFVPDRNDVEFDATLKLLRDKRNKYYREIENNKNENLAKKNDLLEKLRVLTDGEDDAHSFETFKEIQTQWKAIGSVPGSHSRTLWANYNALVDRFYDQRNIYFELKELDRKRNLETKIELCERAEKLAEVEKIKDAVKELNELHHEFKHVGPVPREDKENVWLRFKAASDAVYARRDAYMADLQESFSKNKEEKDKLIAEVTVFAEFTSDRIKEWNAKTKEILALQKKWEAIGPVARAHTKETNKGFWTAFKAFFSNKNAFFKKLDGEREDNLKRKVELVAKANALKESSDWDKTSAELKNLQEEWKKVGPVPEKQREKVFQEFKVACDFFFERRREQFGKQDQEQSDNLAKKKAICDTLEKEAADKTGTLDHMNELIEQFNAIGFVPKKAIHSMKTRFDKAVEKYIESIENLSGEEKDRAKMEVQLSGLRHDPHGEQKIHHKEQTIRRQIHKAENDIAILRNNLEFFGRSKNAEKFKSEFNEKLEVATDELKELKKQLKLLKTVS